MMRSRALALLLCCSCAHQGGTMPGDPIEGLNADGSPRWVSRGSAAYKGQYGQAFYGVGVVTGISSESLSRQTAANRARGEIAKLFHSYIASMMRDYQRATSARVGHSSEEVQDVSASQKTITEATLRGVEIRDYWYNPMQQARYALAVLDLGKVGAALEGQSGLPRALRDYVRKNARRAFADLDRELSKRSAGRGNEQPRAQARVPQAPAEVQPERLAPPSAAVEPPAEPSAPAARPQKVRVGLKVSGVNRATVQTCFAERIAKAGFQLYENTSDVDVIVVGQLIYKKAGVSNGAHMVKAQANLRVRDTHDERTLLALNERLKVGRPTLEQAVQLAVSRLCDRVGPRVVEQIQLALR